MNNDQISIKWVITFFIGIFVTIAGGIISFLVKSRIQKIEDDIKDINLKLSESEHDFAIAIETTKRINKDDIFTRMALLEHENGIPYKPDSRRDN